MNNIYPSRLTFLKVIKIQIISTNGSKRETIRGLYRCECGNEVEIKMNIVKFGNRKTCGCMIGTKRTGGATHNLRKHPLYKNWADIKNRCYNEKTPKYKYYGLVGIIMCDEWRNDFKCFYDWCISNGWVRGMEIDKDIKSIKNGAKSTEYSPNNCSIVSKGENNKYRKSTKFIEHNGEIKCITDWCKKYKISPATYRNRVKNGMSISEALTTPLKIKK